jgi:hypothetical protein
LQLHLFGVDHLPLTVAAPSLPQLDLVAVVAETKEEAIAKAQEAIKAGTGGHVPAQRYAQNLLDHLEAEMAEAPAGVAIDWSPAEKSRK